MEEIVCKELGLKPGVKSDGVNDHQSSKSTAKDDMGSAFDLTLGSDWKNHDPGCKLPPKVQPGHHNGPLVP